MINEWIWKEAIMAQSEVLFWRFGGETDENHEEAQSG
jgi:hypothetical protein